VGGERGCERSAAILEIELNRPWHTIESGEALEALGGEESGLSSEEAARRLERHGANTIRAERGVSVWRVLVSQFASPLIYVLLGALLVTLAIQRWSDATVIGLVLIVNTIVGFLQEYRAENAIQALMQMVAPKARVRRDGEAQRIESEQIVPGDIVLLAEGDIVPADMRLLESKSLRVNEAALTGESVPSDKTPEVMEDAPEDLPPADIANMAYMGTAVTSGHAVGVVTATGVGTEVGDIAESIRGAETRKTPLQRRMDRLAKALAVGILLVAAVAFGAGLLMGESVQDMFLLAVALSVAAMPAGLPVVMTVALSVGVRRMAKRHAVIRHLPAVETLGSCTVILSDKTGTLTRNQMTVREIAVGGERLRLGGAALTKTGNVERDGEPVHVEPGSALYTTLLVGVLASDARVWERAPSDDSDEDAQEEDEPTLEASGDPMESALLVAGLKAGLEREALLERYERIDEVPFQTERRYSASIHEHPEGAGPLVCVKGAPEVVLGMCDRALDEDGSEREIDADLWRALMDDMADSGMRVLAMAIGHGEDAAERTLREEPGGLTFAGMCGLLDPPRESAVRAVDDCRRAGIRVIMVTGDHARTAAAIGRQTHIGGSEDGEAPQTRLGRDIAKCTDEELDETLAQVDIYARFKPDQKLRLVRRLREQGEIPAVTGDGVNDAPALKEADLGAAMGRTGSDVAKEASDMVVTDDNFASVYAAVEEGRTAFRNIRMATFFLLSTGAADVLIILGALGAGWPLPLLPAQILWCNVVTNGIADVALGFEPGERALFQRPPRPPKEGILHRPLLIRLGIIGVWLSIGTLCVFYWMHAIRETSLEEARTAALTTLVLFQKVHVFNCRSESSTVFLKSLLKNKVLLIGVLASLGVHIGALYAPWTQELLGVRPLDGMTWLVMAAIAATAIIPNEIHKWILRRQA